MMEVNPSLLGMGLLYKQLQLLAEKVPILKMRVDKIVVDLFSDGENLQGH